ncbi:P-loop NTPase [bacterium]|nr:P-loop NTPase [bacterium]
MKIAISGKGGVGKSTIAAALSLLLAKQGKNVLALDADPDANLAAALGITKSLQETVIPISRQVELIEERTGAKINRYGQIFKLNPEVADVSGKFGTRLKGINLIVLGAVKQGGSGCACPESVFIKSLVTDLVLYKDDILIVDMEAGVEHLGRATARGVDAMLVVVEPGQRSIDCAFRIIEMAAEIGIKSVQIIANKICSVEDEIFIKESFPGKTILSFFPFSDAFRHSDKTGLSVLDSLPAEITEQFERLLSTLFSIKDPS